MQLLIQNLRTCMLNKTRIYSQIRGLSSKCWRLQRMFAVHVQKSRYIFSPIMSQVHAIHRIWKSLHKRIPEARIFSCTAYDFKTANCKSPNLHVRVLVQVVSRFTQFIVGTHLLYLSEITATMIKYQLPFLSGTVSSRLTMCRRRT